MREREQIERLVSDNKPDQTERGSSCYQLEHINFLFEFRIPMQKNSSHIYQCFRYDKWKAKFINFIISHVVRHCLSLCLSLCLKTERAISRTLHLDLYGKKFIPILGQ